MSNAPGSWSQAPHVKPTTATVPGAIALMAIVPRGRDFTFGQLERAARYLTPQQP